MHYKILNSCCIAAMQAMPDNSVDSIVTDPPYELGFMGKAWDASGIANNVEMWREALRVLKPGGHLLAFSGSRTYHRMTCAIEDAGFEVRDQIMWVYGSGFPKSLDVSKAIDKQDAADMRRTRQLRFTEWMRSTGLTSARIDELTGTNMGGHYTTGASQPAVATRGHLEAVRPFIVGPVPEWVEAMVDERTVESLNFKAREITGQKSVGVKNGAAGGSHEYGLKATEVDITAPATDAARQWEGWGTALKPAHEPICVARKPLIGTVAANVLAHGTGALNIDGCRVGDEVRFNAPAGNVAGGNSLNMSAVGMPQDAEGRTVAGRWPANLIHDGSAEVLAAFPDAKGQQGTTAERQQGALCGAVSAGEPGIEPRNDAGSAAGSAARFFYCAKASKSDRGPENVHPTVKPTELMAYLVRLVTPLGGLVLDPFMGSGSTGKAAMREGFRFIGCELSPEYAAIAEARISEEFAKDIL